MIQVPASKTKMGSHLFAREETCLHFFFACGGRELVPALSYPVRSAAVRERRLVCISFSLAGDAKKKSRCPPVFELVDEHALWHVRILIQVSSSTKKNDGYPLGTRHFLVRERRLELPRRLTHAPQTCLSTCSSTLAYGRCSGSIESRLHHFGLPHLRQKSL